MVLVSASTGSYKDFAHEPWNRQDKHEFADLARRLAKSSTTHCSVAVVNYRLSKMTSDNTLVHPAHAEDVLHFLEFAKDWEGPEGTPVYDRTRIYALGHSCGAHILTSIFMRPPHDVPALKCLTPSRSLIQSIRGVILSNGGYDLDHILREYPEYRDILTRPGFGELPSYEAFNPLKYQLHEGGEDIRWLVIYTQGDKVIVAVQSKSLYERLRGFVKAAGKREERVQLNSELTTDHNGIYTDVEYPRVVHSFISQDEI